MRDGALSNCALRFFVASASARRLPVRMPLRAFSGPFACWTPGTVGLQNNGQRDKKHRAERKRDRHRRASAFEERKRSACKRQCRRSGACRPGLSWAVGADAPPSGGWPDGHSETAINRLARSNRPLETAGHADAVDDFRLKSKGCVTRAYRRRELHFIGTDPSHDRAEGNFLFSL